MEILEDLLLAVRETCAGLPDKRRGRNVRYAMADIGLAAFSVFFMQSPSFLAYQRSLAERHSRSNCQTLFGMSAIPTDNHIRQMLDGAPPGHFDGLFEQVVAQAETQGGLQAFRRLGAHVLIALDGTEYFTSRKLHCPQCSQRRRSDGGVEYFHGFLGATLVAPGHAHVLPLAPEFVVPQDGHEKQDCESRAVRRWLVTHGPRYAPLQPIYLGDDLFACQPICAAVKAVSRHFLFTCKPQSHPTIREYLTGVELPERRDIVRRGRDRSVHRYRWLADVPMRDGADAMTVNWLEIEITNAKGKLTYRNSFVTDLPVDRDNVAELAACGRARWKIENESFNVLKNNGYNLEHNFGHGKATLSAVLVVLNLLAFALHHLCELVDGRWRDAVAGLGARRRIFEHLRSATAHIVFPSWNAFLRAMIGLPPPIPP